MSIMSPETLASLLEADPYPGCIVTSSGGIARLDFDGLILFYNHGGWCFNGTHLESTLSEHSAPEQVHPEIRRILKVVMTLKVERALNEAEADGTTDPVAYLTNLAAEKMLAILDVAALANARQAEIGRLAADIAARDVRIAELARDLADKGASLKTAHAALKRICEVIGTPVPCVAEDAVEAVKRQLGDDNDANARAKAAEQALKDINLALLDAGAPRAYTLDKDERPIPDADRVRILGDRVRGEWRERSRVEADHSERGKAINDAHLALDDRKAPRLADGVTLTTAARIRSLPRGHSAPRSQILVDALPARG